MSAGGRRLPRLVVAAPATGQGKTTIATGLMAALRHRGRVVSGHKVGPDYIDPGYHALATRRPGRNLDPHLVGEERVVPLLLHGARGADVAVVEGVMGLYDGRVGGAGFASTAHVAALTRTPVLLVVDCARASRSVGAVVHGMATYDPSVQVVGVVLNQVGSPRHAAEVESSVRLPVVGRVPREVSVATPSRHLGLVPAAERGMSAEALDPLVDLVERHVDLDAVLELAAAAPDLDAVAAAFRAKHGFRLRIATKYHRLVREFLRENGVADYQLVDSQGATEGTIKNETAEAIADITSSGETLRANHLKILSDGLILRSQATLWRSRMAEMDDADRATMTALLARLS